MAAPSPALGTAPCGCGIWRAATAACSKADTAGGWALAVLPDGRALSGSGDGTLRLWDLESGDSRVLEGHAAGGWALAVLPDGRALSGSGDGTLRLWDLESRDSRVLEGHTAGGWALAVLPDGRALSGSGDGTLRLCIKARKRPRSRRCTARELCAVVTSTAK